VSAALVERGSVGERLFEPSWTNLPMVALVTTAAPITPETGMMQASQIYLLGTAPGAILLWLVFGPGLNAGLFTLLLRERGLKFALVSTAVTLVITLMPAFAVDAALFDSTKVAVEDSHAFDETGRPFHMGENDKRGPRATAGRLLLRETGTTQGVSLVALAAVALVRVLPAGARVDRSVPSRWNRPLPRSVLPVLLIGGCVAFVVTGFYAFYPAPAQTLRDMKRIDAELGVAVRTGRIDEARPCIAQLRTLALRAVTGDTLRLWRGGSDLREGMIEYEKRLAELDGLLDRDDAPARVDGMIEASKQLGLVVGALNRR